jgi:hypothetical protein
MSGYWLLHRSNKINCSKPRCKLKIMLVGANVDILETALKNIFCILIYLSNFVSPC